MAIDFGSTSTEISTPAANAVRPTQGVVVEPTALRGVNDVIDTIGTMFQNRKDTQNQQLLTEFTAKQTLVTDALEQGRIRTAAQARTMMRSNFLDAISASPGLRDDLVSAQKDVLGLFGDSSLISQGTLDEQRRNDRRDQLTTAGLLDDNASDAEFEAADSSAQIAVAAKDRFDERMRTINLEMATSNLSAERRSNLSATRKTETLRYLQDTSPVEFQSMQSTFDQILQGQGSEADKAKAMQDHYTAWRSQANAMIGEVELGEFNAFMKPFEMLQETYLGRAQGTLDDAETSRRIERIMRGGELLALSDPAIADAAVASKLFDSAVLDRALINNDRTFGALLNFLSKGSSTQGPGPAGQPGPEADLPSPFVNETFDQEGLDLYPGAVVRGLESGDADVQAESATRMGNLLTSVEDYEGLIRRNPTAGITLVNWFASPDFLKARNAHPELFGDVSVAQEVIQNHYESEVWGMVSREFQEANVGFLTGRTEEIVTGTFGGRPMTSQQPVVGQSPVSMAVAARATASGMEFYSIIPNPPQGIKDKVRELNSTLAPVINTTLRSAAHLNGESDYSAAWEKVSTEILGAGGEGIVAGDGVELLGGGDADDDLTTEDFLKEVAGDSSVDQFVEKIIGVESAGNPNAKNPLSSAEGLGQFIDSTWVAMMNRYRPELVSGKSREEVLAMKFDADLSREMTTNYARENAEALRKSGFEATPGNIYLSHFLGSGGARSVLRANPEASAESVVGSAVISANPFLEGKTVAQLIAWAERKMR